MTLQAGTRLGVYEIRGPLGAGGMGEVYRAWDAPLSREVAVKVLPEKAAADPGRLRRFEQVAKAAGALNHPNVLAVYDVGEHESLPYIVSELSPDRRLVLSFPGNQRVRDHLILVPTGAGERRELRHPSIHEFAVGGAWFPDGRRIACTGAATPEKGMRLLVWDIETGAAARPLSPEGDGVRWPVVSSDGRWVAVVSPGKGPMLYAVDGGLARRLPGSTPDDVPMRWSADGRWIYVRRGHVWHRSESEAFVDRIEVATGIRQPWRVLKPADPAGVYHLGLAHVTPDGKGYAYSIRSSIGSLYLAEGLR